MIAATMRLGYAGRLLQHSRGLGTDDNAARNGFRNYAADIVNGLKGSDHCHLRKEDRAALFAILDDPDIQRASDIVDKLELLIRSI